MKRTHARHLRKRLRGYILLEVAVGGAMVAVLIATLLTSVAEARTRNVVAGRDAIAAQLVQAQVERERSVGYSGTPSATCVATLTVVASQTGSYRRSCTAVAFQKSIVGVTLDYKAVTVVVEFDNSITGTRSITAITEVYQ